MLVEAMLLLASDPAAVHCGPASLADAVADYAARIRAMDTDGIASLYGDTGQAVMGERTLTGRAEVAAFLAQFKAYRVTGSTMSIVETVPAGLDWHVAGRFTQSGVTPDGTAYQTHGAFTTDWKCAAGGHWRVVRMETVSD